MFQARIFIRLKPTVNDPEGITVHGGLRQLGFDSVESVRAGKFIEVRLNDEDEEVAAENVRQMCDKLLANPIIEDYSFELERIGED